MSAASHLLGISSGKVTGIEFWPPFGRLVYADDDLDLLYPGVGRALIETTERPPEDIYPLRITIEQMHEFNFRVREIYASFLGSSVRHSYPDELHSFPEDESMLHAWPGAAIYNEGVDGGAMHAGINIAFPKQFAPNTPEFSSNPSRHIAFPNDLAFPVLCSGKISYTWGPEVSGETTGPAAAYFFDGHVYPYIRLEWLMSNGPSIPGSLQSNVATYQYVSARIDTGFAVQVFDWGRVPIYQYFAGTPVAGGTLLNDESITATRFFTYGGLWDEETGARVL